MHEDLYVSVGAVHPIENGELLFLVTINGVAAEAVLFRHGVSLSKEGHYSMLMYAEMHEEPEKAFNEGMDIIESKCTHHAHYRGLL